MHGGGGASPSKNISEALVGIDNCLSVGSINGYMEKMEGFLEEYFNLAKKLKYCLGERYDEPHGELKRKYIAKTY